MIRPRVLILGLGLSVAVLALAGRAHAAVILALDFQELTSRADVIVVGEVTRIDIHRDDFDRIVTDATISVTERWKGSVVVGKTLTARSLGGTMGDVGLRVSGEPAFIQGDRLLFFGRLSPNGPYFRAVGMSQGVFPVRRTPAGTWTVSPGANDLALVRQDAATGRLSPKPPALLKEAAIEDIRRTIARALGGAK